jgi:subtilisin family serine protease
VGLKTCISKSDPGKTRSQALPDKLKVVLPVVLLLSLVIPVRVATAAPLRAAGRLLVQPKTQLAETELDARLTSRGARQMGRLHRSNVRVVQVRETDLTAVLDNLRSDPEIEFAEPDYIAKSAFVPNDPRVQSGDAWHLERMQATGGWEYTVGGSNVVVAVLDSGVSAAHPDLTGRLLAGYDFVNGDADHADDFGHGTAVTGAIVASGNNGVGSAGVAFGCRVLPIKVMGPTGYAYYSAIAEGIRYAVDQGARVINISIAGDLPSATLQSAIDYAWSRNVVVVAAAGNTGNSIPQYPAACARVLAIGATESTDLPAGFSSYGSQVRLTAPGVNIWTTQRSADAPFGTWRGTSFASPLAAGAAALLLSAQPELSNEQVVTLLEASADDLGPVGRDDVYGYGRLNVLRALIAAGAQITLPPPATAPPQIRMISPEASREIRLGETVAVQAEVIAGSAPIARVELLVDGLKQQELAAPLYELNWLPLEAGEYSLTAVATDAQGQRAASAPVTLRVVAMGSSAPIKLEVIGDGRISPDLNGRMLVVGQTYTVRAKPGRDQLFAGWEGLSTFGPELTFVMQAGLELKAHFVPSPFVDMKGTFHGLAANPDRVVPEATASFTLTLSRMGSFSGKLQLGGRTHSFRGRFDLDGRAAVFIERPLATPLELALTLDLAAGGTVVSGSINGGAWSAALRANRSVFNRVLNPAPQAGSIGFILADGSATTTTVASGANKIAASGRSKVTGRLQDGRKFARAASLAANGDFPFYLALAGGAEVVIGWVNFPAQTLATANGTVVWARSGTNAFATTLQAAGAP